MTRILTFCLCVLVCPSIQAADWTLKDNPELAKFFEDQVRQIERQQSLFRFHSRGDWESARPELRRQLFDMLGIDPQNPRPKLQVRQTGIVEHDDFVVEKLWLQTLPGLYVTANFYRPHDVREKLPTILYVCGHARMKGPDGVSYGNKTGYQHHGAWFARNGYTCLMIDTLQLGEIEGIHHGTYSHGRWWWNARGYTPAGVEAWNCIRALDYLETRTEVDEQRIGVTGRSGGGAYSWWIAALDDRIRCAVPVAGITTLRNHVVDGCVEGHCDCMYMVNTYRWDYPMVAALVAPRPLLISNSDKDRIFPLDGVLEVHRQVRHIYELYDKPDQLGLQITEGLHKDTQELRIHAFRWFNRWLRHDDQLIDHPAVKFFEPSQLRVFDSLPPDQKNTQIDEIFTAQAEPFTDESRQQMLQNQKQWVATVLQTLKNRCFAAWPPEKSLVNISVGSRDSNNRPGHTAARMIQGRRYTVRHIRFQSQPHVELSVEVLAPGGKPTVQTAGNEVCMLVLNEDDWAAYESHSGHSGQNSDNGHESESWIVRDVAQRLQAGQTVAVFCPRGIGPHAWKGDQRKLTQIRRRFQLIGTTVDALRVWDIRAAIAAMQKSMPERRLKVCASGVAGWLCLTAASFSTDPSFCVRRLQINREEFPVYLNFARALTPESLFVLALHRSRIDVKSCHPVLMELRELLLAAPEWAGRTRSESRADRSNGERPDR